MPASFGVHGPGDRMIACGLFFSACSALIASLRTTSVASAEVLDVVDEVVDEAVVIIDDQDHGVVSMHLRCPRRQLRMARGIAP